ncbi:protein kinase [Cryptosporidium ubiquitum]|uniref:Protein kinase n=1 Tax=Cryptosporidium ubiquitum TaxID=857276 RepID=A0A1J4MJ54_9CRYT|nr:protein kinase [Cryptosporidium ubiquitum]OII74290.1 protein kinase [Cryptosporidium ubiquitum]
MSEDSMISLVEELEIISRDEHTIIHILDFGFISTESARLCGLQSFSNNYKSSGSLILFEDGQSNDEINDSSICFDLNSESNINTTRSNRDLLLTVLVGNICINNTCFALDEHINNRIFNSRPISPENYLNSRNTLNSFSNLDSIDPSIENNPQKQFKGIEIEISINNQYPSTPPDICYLSHYNLNKDYKEKIKINVDKFLKNSQIEYRLTQVIGIIKNILNCSNRLEESEQQTQIVCENELRNNKEGERNCLEGYDHKLISLDEKKHEEDTHYMLSSNRFEDNFEVIKILGYGGFGSVFMAREHFGGKCTYAIKQIPLSSRNLRENQMLINEAAMLACLNHEKIVRYYHAWVQESVDGNTRCINNELFDDNIYSSFAPELISQLSAMTAQYITNDFSILDDHKKKRPEQSLLKGDKKKSIYLFIQMEYCSGYSLQNAIDKGLIFNNQKLIWHIFYQIVQGLSYLHGKGVIHRDLKPSNIFLQLDENNSNETQEENWYLVKLGDFGLTTFVNIFERFSYPNNSIDNLKANKELSSGVGTMFYMAPEQCKGNSYNQSADMFSLGVILFEMYHPPFKTGMERVQILTQLTKYSTIPKNCNIPNKVQILIKSLLNQNPEERPTSYQLLYNEWILKQTKFYLNLEDSVILASDLDLVGARGEYSSQKICDIISRNPYIHENIQILSTLFSIEKRSMDKQFYRSNACFSYFPFHLSNSGYKICPFQTDNILLNHHHYYKKRSELITYIKNIFKTHGATEVGIPILFPKINNKNLIFDEKTQSEINCNDRKVNFDLDYLILSTNERFENDSQKNKKGRKHLSKKNQQSNKEYNELNESITISDNPLTVVLLDRSGNPLVLCNNILKSMSAQLGDGQGLRMGAVIKRFYIDSIYTQDNLINLDASNSRGAITHGHPKELLFGTYEIVVKINDRVIEEFDSVINFFEFPIEVQNISGNLNISPMWYYNIIIYYDIEIIITALDTLKPYEMFIGQPILVWGDSQFFIALLESWIGIKYDKGKYLQIWLQNMIPKGISRGKLLDFLQKITLISLAEFVNSYNFDREIEGSNIMKTELPEQIVKYYIGLKILSYPSILEKVVEYIFFIINDFKGSIQNLIELINKGTNEIFNLFEMEKKKFIITCKNGIFKELAKVTRYPLFINLLVNNKGFNGNFAVNFKTSDSFNEEKILNQNEVFKNPELVTPNLLKVIYRIFLFNNLLNSTNLGITKIFFDPILFSNNNFFESGFFFYIFSGETSFDQNNIQTDIQPFGYSQNITICKVGCIMDLIFENKYNINNSNSPYNSLKHSNVELLVKGGRLDNWYISANTDKVIFFKNYSSKKNNDKISAVGFEIVLERIIYKLLRNTKFKTITPPPSSSVPNNNELFSNTGIHVFILNNTKYQLKSFKLRQLLLLKGIKCQRNISSNNLDTIKQKSHIKSRFPSLHWIVHIIRGNFGDNRKHLSMNSLNKSSHSPYQANNSYSNLLNNSYLPENQNNLLFSEIKYKIEWCLFSDNNLSSYAKEFINNYSGSGNPNNMEMILDNENALVQFFIEFYCMND